MKVAIRKNTGNRNNTEEHHRINNRISALEVRLVGDNVETGIYPIRKALEMAEELGVDLVEISQNPEYPICKLVEYQKFLYQQKKKQKEMKAKTAKVVIKEIRFGPQTDEHDFNFKVKHAINFLKEGDKVMAYVFFRGRSIIFKNQGEELLTRMIQAVDEYGVIESSPKLEGKRMIMMIAPKKKKQ